MTGIDVDRIANGKLVECWTKSDDLGLLQQIGGIPAPTQTAWPVSCLAENYNRECHLPVCHTNDHDQWRSKAEGKALLGEMLLTLIGY
jgi:hypothetical protein